MRKNYQKAQKKDGKKLIEINMAYDIDYSLNITLIVYMASSNKWILNIEATYHLCSFRELLVDFDMESDIVVMKSD